MPPWVTNSTAFALYVIAACFILFLLFGENWLHN